MENSQGRDGVPGHWAVTQAHGWEQPTIEDPGEPNHLFIWGNSKCWSQDTDHKRGAHDILGFSADVSFCTAVGDAA